MFKRAFRGIVLMLVTSFYLFPISFTFLPYALNSKILVGVFGIAAFLFDSITKRAGEVSRSTIGATLLAAVFSVWCLYSVTVAGTYEMDYASYIVSFFTWMAGAYGVYAALRIGYGEVNIGLLIRYLAIVGVFQCISAVLIDNNPAFSDLVDRVVAGNEYYREHRRMYGIGAALDPAGIRFSVILVMIAHQFSTDPVVHARGLYQATDLIAFTIITIIGVVISRTTMAGASLGLAYMILSLVRLRQGGFITLRMMRIFIVFLLVFVLLILLGIYLFRTNATFEGYLRFGFEAFFNWAETGEFRTNSTDELSKMWVWPTDTRTWIIGRGTYGVFENDTDIGYCNFIFYCGMIGLTLFSIFFLYVHLTLNRKYRKFGITSLLLVALTFIIWLKVTTDIFFIDALLMCIPGNKEEEEEVMPETETVVV